MGSVSPEQHRGVAFCTVPTLTYSRVASRCALLHTTQNLNNGSHATNRDQCTASEFTVVRINLYLGLFWGFKTFIYRKERLAFGWIWSDHKAMRCFDHRSGTRVLVGSIGSKYLNATLLKAAGPSKFLSAVGSNSDYVILTPVKKKALLPERTNVAFQYKWRKI